jgi:hypothetical protein
MKTGSLTPGEEGYEVYLTLVEPGAVSWENTRAGRITRRIVNQKRTGKLIFNSLTAILT